MFRVIETWQAETRHDNPKASEGEWQIFIGVVVYDLIKGSIVVVSLLPCKATAEYDKNEFVLLKEKRYLQGKCCIFINYCISINNCITIYCAFHFPLFL
jgi:hypothetical protein